MSTMEDQKGTLTRDAHLLKVVNQSWLQIQNCADFLQRVELLAYHYRDCVEHTDTELRIIGDIMVELALSEKNGIPEFLSAINEIRKAMSAA